MRIIKHIFRPDPEILYIEPYFGCNYKCFFCIHGGKTAIQPAQLQPETFQKLKPVIDTIGHVHITGLGEPFLNPHLTDYLLYFRERGKKYYLNTNGSLIQDGHVDVMTTSMCELSISLDAADKETYANVRHPEYWDIIISRLKQIAEIKARRKSPFPLIYLTLHLNSRNLASLPRLPDLCKKIEVQSVRLSWTILPESHAIYSVFNDQTHADQIIQDVSKHLNSMGVGVQNQAHFEEHFRGCWDLRSMTFVGANGTVAACCSRWIALGSLHQNTFEDIWNGMPHRRIGFGIFNGKPTAPCRSCRQIRPLGYKGRKEDFIMPQATGEAVLKEKTRKLDTLPTLKGLDTDFAAGVKALFSKDFQDALKIFSKLEDRFPDFYEIKNNLAITHHFLKNESKSHELLKSIEKMAFMETMM